MNKKDMLFICLFVLVTAIAWSQATPGDDEDNYDEEAVAAAMLASTDGPSVSIALSDQNYPVTPGDFYLLGYAFRGQVLTQNIVVTSDYILDLGIFGQLETKGLTFLELKDQVQNVIADVYPGSHPNIVLQAPGEFNVTVSRPGRGQTRIVAWGLIRLADVIEELGLEEEYSRRNILIRDSNGRRTSYDHYDYLYRGDEDANPLVRPGDRIEFSYNRNRVEIIGAVMSPGIKEIVPRDTMDDIVLYVGDFQSTADVARIQKSEVIDGDEVNSVHEWGDRSLFVGNSDFISIFVPNVAENRNPMYVEINGGLPTVAPVTAGTEEISAEDESQVGRVISLELPVFEGMRVSDILGRIEPHFTDMSDLERSHLIREDTDGPMLINLESVMRSDRSAANIELQPGDRLGIPSRTVFVTVAGAVYEPGRYYYTPMRTAGYYITLAGGIDPEQGSHRRVTVYDEDGNEKHDAELIEPGDNIVAVQDNLAFQFDQKFGTIISGLALITSLVTLITVTLAVN